MGKFTAFKVQLKSLPQGIHEFEYHLDKTFFANMESTDIHDADIRVHLTLNYKADIYDLAFKIDGDVTLLCDRCLDTAYHIAVKYGDDYDDSSDDLLVIPESDNYLNVAYMLYDTVALSIPLKHVHPAGKCNRQMSAMLKKHSARGGEDDVLADELIDEIDNIEMEQQNGGNATDSRWDALKGFNPDNE